MPYVMEANEIESQLKYTGEWGEYLLSLVTAERLVGKHPGLHLTQYGANFIRTSANDEMLDHTLIMVTSYGSGSFEIRFMIQKDRNHQLGNYVQRYKDKNPEKVEYAGQSGRFYNTNFRAANLDEMKELFNETFVKSYIYW